jgi:hypothetical protein
MQVYAECILRVKKKFSINLILVPKIFSALYRSHYRPYFPQLESYSRLTAEKIAGQPSHRLASVIRLSG